VDQKNDACADDDVDGSSDAGNEDDAQGILYSLGPVGAAPLKDCTYRLQKVESGHITGQCHQRGRKKPNKHWENKQSEWANGKEVDKWQQRFRSAELPEKRSIPAERLRRADRGDGHDDENEDFNHVSLWLSALRSDALRRLT
jgi:hypothetical protein